MRILTFNVNDFCGTEATRPSEKRKIKKAKKDFIEEQEKNIADLLLDFEPEPDIIVLQEFTYSCKAEFKEKLNNRKIKYELVVAAEEYLRNTSRVAIAVRKELTALKMDTKMVPDRNGKWLAVKVGNLNILGVHVPCKKSHNIDFWDCIGEYADTYGGENTIIIGDFNPTNEKYKDKHEDEKKRLENFVEKKVECNKILDENNRGRSLDRAYLSKSIKCIASQSIATSLSDENHPYVLAVDFEIQEAIQC
ncbi:MAG: endonuclease/exonuclease/phosphatase family protein [Oscillospiraceae bacterium]|nr:endonuclease/exonuclease/phosphatase family protein [Oscillospiraceae bacterium]